MSTRTRSTDTPQGETEEAALEAARRLANAPALATGQPYTPEERLEVEAAEGNPEDDQEG